MMNIDKFPEREMYCSGCKKDYTVQGINPSCPVCKRTLVNILFAGGRRITGVESNINPFEENNK